MSSLDSVMDYELSDRHELLHSQSHWDFSGLRALFFDCTLKPTPALSHTEGPIRSSAATMNHLHDGEPAPSRPNAARCRGDPGAREPVLGVGRPLLLRLPELRAPVGPSIQLSRSLEAPQRDRYCTTTVPSIPAWMVHRYE